MSRHARFTEQQIIDAKVAVEHAKTVEELRQAQAVLLPALHGLSMEDTGAVMGVSRATVGRFQQWWRKPKKKPASSGTPATRRSGGWGGRRNCHMTLEQEAEFLEPWAAAAESAGMIVTGPIRAALAERLGQPVKASVVCRLLARHGWRKVAPDTKHPKADPAEQAAWKKKPKKSWRPCSSATIRNSGPCG